MRDKHGRAGCWESSSLPRRSAGKRRRSCRPRGSWQCTCVRACRTARWSAPTARACTQGRSARTLLLSIHPLLARRNGHCRWACSAGAANLSVSHRYPYPFPYAYHFTSQFYASPIHATPPLPSYSPVSLTKANIAAAELAQGARVTVLTVFSRITREKFKRNGDLFLMPRMRRLCGNGAPRALLLLAGPRTHLRDCATCLACWASHSVYSR
jgi:hypothetical protein